MRKTLVIPIVAVIMALTACHHADTTIDDLMKDNAALQIYAKYADNHNLTVAYLGNLCINEQEIDAVMLQADDETEWAELCADFSLKSEKELQAIHDSTICADTAKHVSMGIGIESDLLDVLGKDTLTSRDEITKDDIDKVAHYIAVKIQDILSSFRESDTSAMPHAAISIGGGPTTSLGGDISYEDYINLIADALAQSLIEEYFNQADSLALTQSNDDPMLNNAKNHGHCGYVTAADYKNQALWLFFYDNQEELNVILNHIKDDIIIGQQ